MPALPTSTKSGASRPECETCVCGLTFLPTKLQRRLGVDCRILLCISDMTDASRDERNRRGCSDGFEISCRNGERVRVAFALDCCDREAMSFLATTGGIAGGDGRALMVAAVEYRFGQVTRLPVTIEWRFDDGGSYRAGDTADFAGHNGLEPRT